MSLRRRAVLGLGVGAAAALGVGGFIAEREPSTQAALAAIQRRINAAGRRPAGPGPPPARVQLRVSVDRILRPISPLIYGVAVADEDHLRATGARLNRWGGNPNTRYNWLHGSAWNAARDWEFRNYGGPSTAASSAADTFVQRNRSLGVASLLTVPAIGWVARDGDTDTRSVDVPAAGGPPLDGSGDAIAGYDPAANRAATSVASFARKGAAFKDPPEATGHVYQDEWISRLVSRFGAATAGGVRFYAIDNEPDLWSVTHTDVHPLEASYDDVLAIFLDYATAIKDVDPGAAVLGPTLSGWTALQYSARDRGTDNFRTHADRRAHGDVPFLAWWLEQVRQHDERAGRRSLDLLDVHFYPQAERVFSGASDLETNALRLRSTRALWDPTYVDESWIGQAVELIPRLRRWVDQYYPGTGVAINEWNWGADQTLNGALAIAEVLGVFGREGVDMACYWTAPAVGSPGAFAFGMYTQRFGDTALDASSDFPDDVSVFASRASDSGEVLVMALNQRPDADVPCGLRIEGMPGSTLDVEAWRYSAARLDAVEPLGVLASAAASLDVVLPRESITLVRARPTVSTASP